MKPLPGKIKQIQVVEKNKIKLVEMPFPKVDDNSVVLKTILSGISHGTEIATIQKSIPSFNKRWDEELNYYDVEGTGTKKFPSKLGYENISEVIFTGKNVNVVKEGDIIWVDAPHQDYSVVNLETTPYFKIGNPKNIKGFTSLALLRVALAGVHDASPLIGDEIFVSGLGTVGILTSQLLRFAGIRKVVASDPVKFRRKFIETKGILAIDSLDTSFIKSTKEIYRGFDISIETSGSIEGLLNCIKLSKKCGTIVTVSTLREPATKLIFAEEYHKNRLNIISSMSVNDNPHRRYPNWNLHRLNQTAYDLINNGDIDTTSYITKEFNFLNADIAYEQIINNSNKIIKSIFTY